MDSLVDSAKHKLEEALKAHHSGAFAQAEADYRALLDSEPDNIRILNALGVLLGQQGRGAEALPVFQHALDLAPSSPAVLGNYGHLLHVMGRHAAAVDIFEKALVISPQDSGTLYNMGLALIALKRHKEAISVYWKLRPYNKGGAYTGLGLGLMGLGRKQGALFAFNRAQRLGTPRQQKNVFLQKSMLLKDLGKLGEAIALLDLYLAEDSRDSMILMQKGLFLVDSQDEASALTCFMASIESDPSCKEAWLNAVGSLSRLRRSAETVPLLQDYLKRWPGDLKALHELAHSYIDIGDIEKARPVVDTIFRKERNRFKAHRIKARFHKAAGAYQEAIRSLQSAVRLDPKNPAPHISLALCYLATGQFARGFEEYDWRWKIKADDVSQFSNLRRDFPERIWQRGQTLGPKEHLLLIPEQGHGDFIQFSRYIWALAPQVKQISVPLSPAHLPMRSLLEGTLPENAKLYDFGQVVDGFSRHATLIEAAVNSWETMPYPPPTPFSIPQESQRFAQSILKPLLKDHKEKKKGKSRMIGLCPSGNPRHKNDWRRSIPLAKLMDYLPDHTTSGALSYCLLHTEMRPEDAEATTSFPSLVWAGEHVQSFADTAAVIMAMDLVITVDTSVAHLSASLGKETWILLPFVPDWRWQDKGEQSPWYPAAKLLRQPRPMDWETVLHRVNALLQA